MSREVLARSRCLLISMTSSPPVLLALGSWTIAPLTILCYCCVLETDLLPVQECLVFGGKAKLVFEGLDLRRQVLPDLLVPVVLISLAIWIDFEKREKYHHSRQGVLRSVARFEISSDPNDLGQGNAGSDS